MAGRVWRYLPPFIRKVNPKGDHRAVIDTLSRAIDLTASDLHQLLENLTIHKAKGAYLDWYGRIIGVERRLGEDDTQYRKRLVFEARAIRQTKQGLKKVIAFYTNNLIPEETIDIFEPHLDLHHLNGYFRTNYSRIPDYTYWTWGVIDIQTLRPVPKEVQEKVEECKAFGIKVFYTLYKPYQIQVPRYWQVRIHPEHTAVLNHVMTCLEPYILNGPQGRLNGGGIPLIP